MSYCSLFWGKKLEEKSKKFKNTGSYIGVGTAIGAAIFAATNDPTWLAVGVALGAAFSWRTKN